MNYSEMKKLDEDSAKNMIEGTGPVDECICSLLSPPEGGKKTLSRSLKKVLATITPGKTKRSSMGGRGGGAHGIGGGGGAQGFGGGGGAHVIGGGGVEIPLVFSKGGQGIYTTKEVVRKKGSCGKCGCDKENIVMKHSIANIRITSPDVSSICPCPTDCLPEKAKLLNNNIKVTVERVIIDPDSENSETSLHNHRQPRLLKEPAMTDKRSVTSLINAQYETDEDKLFD